MAVATQQALALNLIRRVNAGDILTRSASRSPDKLALVDGDLELTYRELDARASAIGHSLLELGLERGEMVGILSRNSWELVATYFACAKAGLVAQPANLGLKPAEIGWSFEQTGARALVVEPELAELAAGLPPVEHTFVGAEKLLGDASPLEAYVEDRDPVQCLYTSGTTALPKGVLTSHVAVTMAAYSCALCFKGDEHAVNALVLPLFHTAALNCSLVPLLLIGGTVILLPGWDARAMLDALERATMTVLLPMMWQELLAQPDVRDRDWSKVRLCVYGMAQMPPEQIAEIHEVFGAPVLLGSGQTEFTPVTTWQRPEHEAEKSGSWGGAVPGVETRIMDDDGNLLPRGEVGEIVYRGPSSMNEYFRNPEATEEAFRYGWFHSGDIGYIDDEGVIWFTDRKKDMVKTGGENVASIEVERLVLSHPAVAECAVVGLPHERWGEAVTAFVLPRPGASIDAAELVAWCGERLAPFKVPKRVVVLDEFPRTGTGKIQKAVLREQHAGLFG